MAFSERALNGHSKWCLDVNLNGIVYSVDYKDQSNPVVFFGHFKLLSNRRWEGRADMRREFYITLSYECLLCTDRRLDSERWNLRGDWNADAISRSGWVGFAINAFFLLWPTEPLLLFGQSDSAARALKPLPAFLLPFSRPFCHPCDPSPA